MNIIDYIKEEVERQGHNTNLVNDGFPRFCWMLYAWRFAMDMKEINLHNIEQIGTLIEPGYNACGFRIVNVQVGYRVCPEPELIQSKLNQLLCVMENIKPMEFYREFEEIHPFRDGNGRTGKVLLNWLNGTLNDPIFPPNDFWGRPIRNP